MVGVYLNVLLKIILVAMTKKPKTMMDTCSTLIVVMVFWVYACAHTHQNAYIKYVHFFGISVIPQKSFKNHPEKINRKI